MNKTKLFTLMALMTANLCSAQRNINMEAVLETPLNGSTWTNGTEVPLTLKLINNGPDNLVAGDTLFLLPNISGVNVQMVTLTGPMDNGASGVVFDGTINLQVASTPLTTDLCFKILDPNSSGLLIGNNPVTVSYNDHDTTNNTACASITFVSDTSGTGIIHADVASVPLTIYPNPANDKIIFAVTVQHTTAARVSVSDRTGRVIKTHDFGIVLAGKQTELNFDATDLPAGMYFVTLYAGERSFVGKVMVQH